MDQTGRTNPIALRLWKIVAPAAFDDPHSREALDIVSERYCGRPRTRVPARSLLGEAARHRARQSVDVWLGAEAVAAAANDDDEDEDDDESDQESSVASADGPAVVRPGSLSRNHSSTTSIRSSSATATASGDHEHATAAVAAGATNARKHFKRDLEAGLISSSLRFLSAFERVDSQLQLLRAHMHEMQDRCETIRADVEHALAGTGGLLRRADGLREQEQSTLIRQEIVTLFLARFTLTPEDVALLKSRDLVGADATVDMHLFEVMDKVKRIRRDCRTLFEFVGAEVVVPRVSAEKEDEVTPTAAATAAAAVATSGGGDDEQRDGAEQPANRAKVDGEGVEGRDISLVAKEIMATTTEHLEDAYEKLHRWAMFEFRKYSRDAQLDVSPAMREAVKRLRERRDLLDDALNLLTTTRQSFLLQSFLEALTRGGPNGLPRPIELHAHDPTRYVGDMLAWVHQATAGEREFVDALFDVQGYQRRMVGEPRDMTGDAEEEEVLARQCLDRALEGLSRPLKVRIQHTVKSQEGVIVTYKITNLVQFYLVTMQRTIGDHALLTKGLQEIFDFAHEAFLETLASQGRSLLRFLHPPEPDLGPPMALRDSSATLHEIMSVYDTSLVDEGDREADFAQILQAALDPLVKMCQHMVDIWGKGTEWEKNIFMINCSLYLQHVLQPYTFTSQRGSELQQQIESRISVLMQEHYRLLSEQSGLYPIVAAMDGKEDPETPLSRLPGAEPKAITQAMKSFEAFLTSLDIMTSSSLTRLASARIASDIHRFALNNIAKDYARIYGAVMDKNNKYEFPSTLLSRDPEDVYMLMGID